MFVWRPEMIRFMRDASEYTDYHAQLASQISAYLPENAQLCDAGCGLGYLSLALCRMARSVTAVDVSAEAIAVLQTNIQRDGIRNIQAVPADMHTYLPEAPFNAMVFSFFGDTAEALSIAKRCCDGVVILIKRNYHHHRYSVGNYLLERFSFAQSCDELTSAGIPFQTAEFALENGQPFHSLQDAVTFFRIYSRDAEPEEITASWVRGKLQEVPSGEFAYYLPSVKQIGLIALHTQDIPTTLLQSISHSL